MKDQRPRYDPGMEQNAVTEITSDPTDDAVVNDLLVEELLVEEISIDGMCGVY